MTGWRKDLKSSHMRNFFLNAKTMSTYLGEEKNLWACNSDL